MLSMYVSVAGFMGGTDVVGLARRRVPIGGALRREAVRVLAMLALLVNDPSFLVCFCYSRSAGGPLYR